jgi:hypothetical protein
MNNYSDISTSQMIDSNNPQPLTPQVHPLYPRAKNIRFTAGLLSGSNHIEAPAISPVRPFILNPSQKANFSIDSALVEHNY